MFDRLHEVLGARSPESKYQIAVDNYSKKFSATAKKIAEMKAEKAKKLEMQADQQWILAYKAGSLKARQDKFWARYRNNLR